jgi:hypothetical protein
MTPSDRRLVTGMAGWAQRRQERLANGACVSVVIERAR